MNPETHFSRFFAQERGFPRWPQPQQPQPQQPAATAVPPSLWQPQGWETAEAQLGRGTPGLLWLPKKWFFGAPKIIKKNDTQIFTILMQFCGLYRFVSSNLGYCRSILGPPRLHFSTSFKDTSFEVFFSNFLMHFRKFNQVKSVQNTAPVHDFRVSPG